MLAEEFEYKYILSEDDVERIQQKLKGYDNSSRIQINYIYDNDKCELNSHRTTVRIRQLNNKLTLDVKIPIPKYENGPLAGNIEHSFLVNELPQSIDTNALKIENMPVRGIVTLVGSIVTHRTNYRIIPGIDVSIDKNWYLGCLDYELEVEFIASLKEKAANLIREILGDDFEYIEMEGKRSRFINLLQRTNECVISYEQLEVKK